MKPLTTKIALATSTAMLTATGLATNGDNLIGIGPNARAMGGVGIAIPQDAISAVFANPSAMCFTPGCAYSEINFAGTLFMPHIKGLRRPAGRLPTPATRERFEKSSSQNCAHSLIPP